jgi:hypothetical protein
MRLMWWAARGFLGLFGLSLLLIGLSVIAGAAMVVEVVCGAAIVLFGGGLSVAIVISIVRGLLEGRRR